MSKNLIIARYKEDISWILQVPNDYTIFIYDKNDSEVEHDVLHAYTYGPRGREIQLKERPFDVSFILSQF